MKFIALWSLKEHVAQEELTEMMARRAGFEFPKGVKVIAEYWAPQSSPAVVNIIETDDAAAMMLNTVAWVDVLDVEVFPVVEWEEGLKTISEHLGGA